MAEIASISPGITVVEGGNFSGRTQFLENLTAQTRSRSGSAVYVGPDVASSISTLVPTVEEELWLHSGIGPDATEMMEHLVDAVDLQHLLHRNPFTLSGGEQARLVVSTALALGPRVLALDCTLEQVDQSYRSAIVDYIFERRLTGKNALCLADNRLKEYTLPANIPITHSRSNRYQGGPLSAVQTASTIGPILPNDGIIRLEDLYFRYQSGDWILKGLSLELHPGRVYTLLGRNGAGKSTLSKILCGVLKPQRGTLTIGKRPFQPWRNPASVFAYHFQNPDVQLFSSTVAAELASGIVSAAMDRRFEIVIDIIIEAFGLSQVTKLHPLDLPFVGRKRVAMAATFAMARPWLILDEPTLGQDELTSRELALLIKSYADNGGGVIVITHSEFFSRELAPTVLMLEGGELAQINAL